MIDVENEEECGQAIVSKDTEDEPQGGAGRVCACLGRGRARAQVHPYEQEVLGDEAEGQAWPRSRGGLGHQLQHFSRAAWRPI